MAQHVAYAQTITELFLHAGRIAARVSWVSLGLERNKCRSEERRRNLLRQGIPPRELIPGIEAVQGILRDGGELGFLCSLERFFAAEFSFEPAG